MQASELAEATAIQTQLEAAPANSTSYAEVGSDADLDDDTDLELSSEKKKYKFKLIPYFEEKFVTKLKDYGSTGPPPCKIYYDRNYKCRFARLDHKKAQEKELKFFKIR